VKTLYEAANAVEAHMLLDLLKQEGVHAHIYGEHLQGAIGELPAAGLVRLVVDEADFDKGRETVMRWEASLPPDEPAPRREPDRASSKPLLWLLAGLCLGGLVTAAVMRTPVTEDGVDHNGDGVLDERWTYSATGTVVRYEVDRNLDGKIDYMGHYDRKGLLTSAEADDDFDGRFETHITFKDNNPEVSETDADGDGYPEIIWRYQHGVLESIAYLNPANGQTRRIEHVKLGKLTTAEVDQDDDGVLDTVETYDALNHVSKVSRITR